MKTNLNLEEKYYPFMQQLFDISSTIIMPYFGRSVKVTNKSDMSPVTEADQNTEKALRKMIMDKFPDHGIIGEEFGSHKSKEEFTWTLDPIDGTKSFISGTPMFGTMIALLQNGEPVLGALNFPALKITVFGNHKKCLINGSETKMHTIQKLAESTLLTTDHFHNTSAESSQNFQKLIKQVNLYRTWGDCYGYYLVAAGFADIMMDAYMEIWDKMPLIPIIKGAGGIISDYNGNMPVSGSGIIAASPAIHSTVINILHG